MTDIQIQQIVSSINAIAASLNMLAAAIRDNGNPIQSFTLGGGGGAVPGASGYQPNISLWGECDSQRPYNGQHPQAMQTHPDAIQLHYDQFGKQNQ